MEATVPGFHARLQLIDLVAEEGLQTLAPPERVGRQIRAGNVNLNGVPNERTAPFGGYKQSGNGREWGKYGLEDFLEVKAIAGA